MRKQVQKYYCKKCGKYQQYTYSYKNYNQQDEETIKRLSKFSMSISSIAAYTGFPKSSIQRKIYRTSLQLEPASVVEKNQEYEIDEMSINIYGMKDVYLIYAINRITKRVVKWLIGPRTKANLKTVVDAVLMCNPKKIYTDRLNSYPSIIPKAIHKAGKFFTYIIERNNLTLRTQIKRLTRYTLCYSRTITMLEACLKIYFWD